MKYSVAFFSSFYAICQIGLGLLLHPYQTLQSVVQEKVFGWMVFFPLMVLVGLMLIWRVLLLPVLEFSFDCYPNMPFLCNAAFFAARWIEFYCLYWEVLLVYLFARFSQVFGE